MTIPEQNVNARSLAWRLFRDAADDDYLISRWCAFVNLNYQHYWHAQQSIEKYLKCHLILNDLAVKSFGHDISKLWDRAVLTCGDLLPLILCPPRYVPGKTLGMRSRFEPAEKFIARINQAGSPDQRYRYFSNTTDNYDLHKLDELVFFLRRICFPLNMPYGQTNKSFREILLSDRQLQPHQKFSFESEVRKNGFEERNKYLRRRNFAFFEDAALEEGKVSSSWSMTNSPIGMAIKGDGEKKEALNWFLSKAYFAKDARMELQRLLEETK